MKISVIIPARNPDMRLLTEALASVHEQTYKDYEILLINDGSDPAHSEEIRKAAGKWQDIRLFETDGSGVCAARNLGAEKARGDVITYLDSDDLISPLCFEEAAAALQSRDIDAVWGGTVYGNADQLQAFRRSNESRQALGKEQLQEKLIVLSKEREHLSRAECIGEPCRFDGGIYINRGIAGRFIKKEKMAETALVFPEGIRIYEDAIWNLQMLQKMRVAYVSCPWYYYLANENSVLNSFNLNVVSDLETPLALIKELIDTDDPEEYTAYTRILMDSLRYISLCLYNCEQWHADPAEKKKLKDHIYGTDPWREIASDRYRKYAQGRDRLKACLYRKKLLLLFWRYK